MTRDRRFYVAMLLYGVLALLVWTTLEYTPIRIEGRDVDFRIIPSLVLGLFALRTIVFRQAERIRAEKETGR